MSALLSASVLSQQPVAAAPSVRAMVTYIEERRIAAGDFGQSKMTVKLAFVGDAIVEGSPVASRVIFSEAQDDTGRSLLLTDLGKTTRFDEIDTNRRTSMKGEAELGISSRRSAALKKIAGTLELYDPSADPTALVTIPDLFHDGGKPVNAAGLAQQGIELTAFNAAQWENWKHEQEAKAAAAPAAATQQPGGMMGAMASAMTQAFVGSNASVGENEIMFVGKSLDKIVKIEFEDATGKPLERGSWSWSDSGRTYSFKSAIQPGTRIKLYLVTAKTVKSFPFSVSDVPLP